MPVCSWWGVGQSGFAARRPGMVCSPQQGVPSPKLSSRSLRNGSDKGRQSRQGIQGRVCKVGKQVRGQWGELFPREGCVLAMLHGRGLVVSQASPAEREPRPTQASPTSPRSTEQPAISGLASELGFRDHLERAGSKAAPSASVVSCSK